MVVGVVDSVVGVADSQVLGTSLAVDVVVGAAVNGEVRGLVDESATLKRG